MVQANNYNPAPYASMHVQNVGPQVEQQIEILEEAPKSKSEKFPKKEEAKNDNVNFLAPVTTFQVLTTVSSTLSFTTSSSNPNYIMTYTSLPTKTTENTANIQIISPDVPAVFVSQPMLINLEAKTGEQFGGYLPIMYSTADVCCQKDSSEAKQPRTPLVPTQHTHSPQLPIPSPNYPIQSQIIAPETDKPNIANTEEARNIPNRNVPIINNNYINTESVNNTTHSDVTSQQSRPGDVIDCSSKLNGETKSVIIRNEATSGAVVHSDYIHKSNNELFNNHVANLNIVNNLNNNASNLTQKTYAQQERSDNGPGGNESSIRQQTVIVEPKIELSQIIEPVIPEADTPKTSNFTVLNIPSIPKFKSLEEQMPVVSKVELSIVKRRERRLKRIKLMQSKSKTCEEDVSDSSAYTSSDEEEIDLWIRAGPPLPPDYKTKKLKFLKIFDLTTHYKKSGMFDGPGKNFRSTNRLFSEVELSKLERRKWLAPWKPTLPDEKHTPCLNLPVPKIHPSALNSSPDYGLKINFLHNLGLHGITDRIREGASFFAIGTSRIYPRFFFHRSRKYVDEDHSRTSQTRRQIRPDDVLHPRQAEDDNDPATENDRTTQQRSTLQGRRYADQLGKHPSAATNLVGVRSTEQSTLPERFEISRRE